MARPQTVTDQQIDAAASAAFARGGAAVPVAAIARKLGVSSAAVLQRVGSKEALLRRSLSPGVPEALRRLEAPPPSTGRRAWLAALLLELLTWLRAMTPRLVVLRTSGALERGGRPREAPTLALRRRLARWLVRCGTGDGRARLLAEALLGAVEARAFNAFLGGPAAVEGDDGAFVRALVKTLLPALDAPGTGGTS